MQARATRQSGRFLDLASLFKTCGISTAPATEITFMFFSFTPHLSKVRSALTKRPSVMSWLNLDTTTPTFNLLPSKVIFFLFLICILLLCVFRQYIELYV